MKSPKHENPVSSCWLRPVQDPRPLNSHGMTAADVQSFVDEIKRHPEVSTALLEEIRKEVGQLMQGQRFSFDFD